MHRQPAQRRQQRARARFGIGQQRDVRGCAAHLHRIHVQRMVFWPAGLHGQRQPGTSRRVPMPITRSVFGHSRQAAAMFESELVPHRRPTPRPLRKPTTGASSNSASSRMESAPPAPHRRRKSSGSGWPRAGAPPSRRASVSGGGTSGPAIGRDGRDRGPLREDIPGHLQHRGPGRPWRICLNASRHQPWGQRRMFHPRHPLGESRRRCPADRPFHAGGRGPDPETPVGTWPVRHSTGWLAAPGREQPRAGIEHARTRHHGAHRGATGGARVPESHVAAGLLVARADGAHAGLGAMQRIEQTVGLGAGQTEDGVHAVRDQRINQCLTAAALAGLRAPSRPESPQRPNDAEQSAEQQHGHRGKGQQRAHFTLFRRADVADGIQRAADDEHRADDGAPAGIQYRPNSQIAGMNTTIISRVL